MNFEIKIDPHFEDIKIEITAPEMTDELQRLIRFLSDERGIFLVGSKNNTLLILEPHEIVRIYADAGRVYAKTDVDEYILRSRLYELEDQLDKKMFVRISNSEIINLKKVKNFDMSFSGTICVHFLNGEMTYVSRRYVSKIKQVLGL